MSKRILKYNEWLTRNLFWVVIISGAFYSDIEKFDVQNNNFQDGDLEIYAEILNVCKEIVLDPNEFAKK